MDSTPSIVGPRPLYKNGPLKILSGSFHHGRGDKNSTPVINKLYKKNKKNIKNTLPLLSTATNGAVAETNTPTSLILLSNHAKTRRSAGGMELVYGIIIAAILSLQASFAAMYWDVHSSIHAPVIAMNVCKKQVLESVNVIHGSANVMFKVIECVTSVFISAAIFIELLVTTKEDQVVVTTLYLAAVMLITICFSVWIGMFQAANVAKAKQVLASYFDETTAEMDDDTTFITKLESFDDGTTMKVDELDTSIFGRYYNYLVTLLWQIHCKWSVNNSDLSSIYIAISGVFTLFQAKSLVQNATSVKRPTTKLSKWSFALRMLAVLLVLTIATGAQALHQTVNGIKGNEDDEWSTQDTEERDARQFPLPNLIANAEIMPNSDSLEALTAIATADYNHEALAIIKNNVNEIASSLHQYSPIDLDLETAQEAFKASVTAISLLKEQLLTMQPLLPVSVGIDPKLFETMSRELMTAEAHMKSIEEFVSENYSKSEPTKRHHLSSRGIPTKNLSHKSSISKADYLIRVQSRHLQKIHNIGKSFETQQGYHPARQSRRHDKGGEKHRRLHYDPDNGQCVHDIASKSKHKEAQCLRLAECAKNYNYYDLIVFFFGDDIDFNTGEIEESKITVSTDLLNITAKLTNITALANEILDNPTLIGNRISPKGMCDQLMQQFHRFDEELSVQGKWQGGTVTGVCKGWGTSKFLSLKSMHTLLVSNLGPEAKVEKCLQGITDDFNRDLADFTLKNDDGNSWKPGSILGADTEMMVRSYFWDSWIPCKKVIADLNMTTEFEDRAINDIRHRFYCLYWSYRIIGLGEGFKEYYPKDPCIETLGARKTTEGLIPYSRLSTFTSHTVTDGKPECVRPLFVTNSKSKTNACDYKIPVVLPSKEDRLSKDQGHFEVDVIPKQNFVNEELIMDIFSEFVNCSNTIVKALDKTINAGELTNPYIGQVDYTVKEFTIGEKFKGNSAVNYKYINAIQRCATKNQILCPRTVYCPNGPLKPPHGGIRSSNVWAPFGGEGDNMWINIGNFDTTTTLCTDHGKYGPPKTSPTTAIAEYYCCTTTSKQLKSTYNLKLYESVREGSKDQFGQLANTQFLDDVFKNVVRLPLVRKVRVEFTTVQGKGHMQLSEVEVFDRQINPENKAKFKRASQSSTSIENNLYYPASNAVDGIKTTYSKTLSAYWEVDLLEDVDVSRIVITSKDLTNSSVSLINSEGHVVAKSLIGESAFATQNFSYPDPAELLYTAPDALTASSKSWLAKRFMDNELLTKNIAYLKDCGTNCDKDYVTIVTGKFSWDSAKEKCAKMKRKLCPRSAICPSGERGEPLGGNRKKELWAPLAEEIHQGINKANQWINIGIKDNRTDALCYDNTGYGNPGEIDDTEVYCCTDTPAGYLTNIEELQTRQADFFDTGLSMDSIDKSISLVFGDKTTIGQVCAYSKGLTSTNKIVVDIPGFCCLDAPYKARDEEWGEKYSCLKYIELSDKSTRVVQKNSTDCNTLGPITSGFNEAACDIFQGTWCPTPRNCAGLVNCIQDITDEVEKSANRQAFFTYLDDAPKVKTEEMDDPTKCGSLRTYFDYDKDFPDDDRICREVKELQCFTDFSNLDGFATGTPGAASNEITNFIPLTVSSELKITDKTEFDGEGQTESKAWRSVNYALRKSIEIIDFIVQSLDAGFDVCEAVALPVLATAVCIPHKIAMNIANGFIYAITLSLDLSEVLYAELVDERDDEFRGEKINDVHANVITVNGNVISIFNTVEHLRVLLGGIQDGLANDEGETNRRLQSIDCTSTANGYTLQCNKPSCEDQKRLCDGSVNYMHISQEKYAGCDSLDSDGDRVIDNCEDQWPPELIVRNAEMFQCENSTDEFCYTGAVFNDDTVVMKFLKYHFPVIDDCQSASKLDVNITQVAGSCNATRYQITPIQNTSSIQNTSCLASGPNPSKHNISHVNPLNGASKEVIVQLDTLPPIIKCGFNSTLHLKRNNSVSSDGKTLYHRAVNSSDSGLHLMMKKAEFFYDITDNCKSDVQVGVMVETNELHQGKIAELIKYKISNLTPKTELLYKEISCDESNGCTSDPDMIGQTLRVYDINVVAYDAARNIGRDQCRVVIIPHDMSTNDADAIVEKSRVRYHIAEAETFSSTTFTPTESPTASPSVSPTTAAPTTTRSPSTTPTKVPTTEPTTASPSKSPTSSTPTESPTDSPSKSPTTASPTDVCGGRYPFETNTDLKAAVDSYISGNCATTPDCTTRNIYNDIGTWCVSNVTDFSTVFKDKLTFNADISQWDVSSATNMFEMFRNAQVFNSDLSQWNVGRVITMEDMFNDAKAFNSNIAQWKLTSANDITDMFNGASSFNQNLCPWKDSFNWDAGWKERVFWFTDCPWKENTETIWCHYC